MSRLLDGAARALILALSAFATLAIIGSIAAIPSGEMARQLGVGGKRPSVVAPEAIEEAAPVPEASGNVAAGAQVEPVAAAAEPEPPEAERWLEVIAYALIAIAGLLAMIALTLMRATAYLRDRAS